MPTMRLQDTIGEFDEDYIHESWVDELKLRSLAQRQLETLAEEERE